MKEGGEARTHTHKASRARKPLVWEKRFFEALREVGTITHACRAARIARRTWYDAVARRPYLLDMEADALDAFADLLEREATRRAVEGVEEPYQVRGGALTTVRRYSDRLLEVLLKAKRPRQFRETPGVLVGGKDVSVFTMDFERPQFPDRADDNKQLPCL